MQQDTRADRSGPGASPRSTDFISDDAVAVAGDDDPRIIEELLVEEISIDGMCGVY